MGRQFSYYCSPEDLAEIEHQVFGPLGAQLLMAQKRDQRHHIDPAPRFPLTRELMGAESLFLLLAPPEPLDAIVFSGLWLDTQNSHLIEVGRCYIQDGASVPDASRTSRGRSRTENSTRSPKPFPAGRMPSSARPRSC